MSFETEVSLGIRVDDGSLRNAKQAIEDELGDVTVGVSGGGAASRASSAGGAGAGGKQSRRLFRWARQRTEYLEESVELLTSIEDKVGGGGGGLFGQTLAARGAVSFGSSAAGTATGLGLWGLAKRWGGRAVAAGAATMSATTFAVTSVIAGSLVASEIIGRSMVTNPPQMDELPPWARGQIAEGQGTTTKGAGRAVGLTSAGVEDIVANASLAAGLGDGGGGRAGMLSSSEVQNIVNNARTVLGLGGGGGGRAGGVSTQDIETAVRNGVESGFSNVNITINSQNEFEVTVDQTADELAQELDNLKQETIREIENRIQNSVGTGRVR